MKRSLLFAAGLLLLVLTTSAAADAPVPAPVPLEQTTYWWVDNPSLPILKAGDSADFRNALARCAVISRKATYQVAAARKRVSRTAIGSYCWMKTAEGRPIPNGPIIYLESFYDGNLRGREWVAAGVFWWKGENQIDPERTQRWEYLFGDTGEVLRVNAKEVSVWGLKKQKWPVTLSALRLTEKQRTGPPTIFSIRSNKPHGDQGTEIFGLTGSRLVCYRDLQGPGCHVESSPRTFRKSTLISYLWPPWGVEDWQLRIFYIPNRPDQGVLAGWRKP